MTENHQNNDISEIFPASCIQSLLAIIEEQNRIISELRAENAQLKTRIAELEARLNQNSRNSNRPPSMDAFRRPRSEEGADWFCRVRGYISTVKKNEMPVFASLLKVFEGNPFISSVAHRSG